MVSYGGTRRRCETRNPASGGWGWDGGWTNSMFWWWFRNEYQYQRWLLALSSKILDRKVSSCTCLFLFLVHSADKHPHSEVITANENTGKLDLWFFFFLNQCFILNLSPDLALLFWMRVCMAGQELSRRVTSEGSQCWRWMPVCHLLKLA